jgi:replicative DNA helicase
MYHCLTDESYLGSIIDCLDSKLFNNDNIRNIINVVKKFYEERDAVPTLTEIKARLTTDDLKTNFKSVVSLMSDFDKKFDRSELVVNTEQFMRERAVYKTMLDIIDNQKTEKDVDTADILSKFEAACNISIQADTGLDYYNDVDKHIQDLLQEDNTIPSTWSWLDEKIGGGFLENGRSIYIFAGETNIGKSIFLGNVAVNIANQGKTVLLISLEMSELVYAKRISTNITQIPINTLSQDVDLLKQEILSHKSKTNGRILIKEFPPSTITCSTLKSFIKKLKDTGITIDALVVDYVNLLTTNTGVNSYERIKHVTERLRSLSYIFSCPVITATQLNRSGYSESNPGLETVSESYGLAATADCMFSIWQEEEDAELGIIKLGLMKNRFGQNFGHCGMRIDYSTLTLTQDDEIFETTNNTLSSDEEFSIEQFLQ